MKNLLVLSALLLLAIMSTACGPVQRMDTRYIQGPKGDSGQDGVSGHDGIDGSNGADGASGRDGLDGATVYMIKFCNGASGQTAFPEYGFCIDNVIYATYSANGNAWTAKIVPGLYSTTTTGLNCSFRVVSGCTVGAL